MHIYFSGIGGAGIGPLALVAKQAGYEVSGSDSHDSSYLKYLTHALKLEAPQSDYRLPRSGFSAGQASQESIHIGQTREAIAAVHKRRPIDWFVYSSALPKTDPNHPELAYVTENGIKATKRDEFLCEVLAQKNLKLIAIAGTHGKTTTTAMVIWLFKQLNIPVSYSVGAKISFGDMGAYDPKSQYFVYECDEFDRNFLSYKPYVSLISGLSYDHHEIYPTRENYNSAFKQFIGKSEWVVLWDEDAKKLDLLSNSSLSIEQGSNPGIEKIKLPGLYNRRDGWLALRAVGELTQEPEDKLIKIISDFPGSSRRFEKIAKNLYSDDAHTPEKIQGCLSVACELATGTSQKIVVIYEPLTNRRMHYLGTAHRDAFEGADVIYWIPSYLAREDPNLPILSPEQLIKKLGPKHQAIAKPMQRDANLKEVIQKHLAAGDMVIGLAGGGGGSLDEWLRKEFSQ